jgi:hypothetical protein
MKTNSLITYLFYAALACLIGVLGFKACQMKRDKQLLKEKQEADMQKTLSDLGYHPADTSASAGSSFAGGNKTATPAAGATKTAAANRNGIEDEPVAVKSSTTNPASTQRQATGNSLAAQQQPSNSNAKGIQDPVPVASKLTSKPAVAKKKTKSTGIRNVDTDARGGKYRVQAGSFSKMEGARRQLKNVIKMGYPNAEIGKTNNGKFSVVVVMRTNDKAEAIKVADKLETKGLDAAVITNGKAIKKAKKAKKSKKKVVKKTAPKPANTVTPQPLGPPKPVQNPVQPTVPRSN